MSVATTDERDRGQPTSWSAAIDALAAGRSFDPSTQGLDYFDDADNPAQRLFVLSAGNVNSSALSVDHLVRSDIDPIHDPGQAWNALTVGAMTEKSVISDPAWASWHPVARPGQLSPWSTTGVTFAEAWPIKPDVVFEGGNVVANLDGEVYFPCPDLSLLTTHFKPAAKPFVRVWPPVRRRRRQRALPHSSRLTTRAIGPRRCAHLWRTRRNGRDRCRPTCAGRAASVPGRKSCSATASVCPTPTRPRSANDALTLVAQSRIRPFIKGKMGELHFFDLPWPRDVLAELGASPVRLRITLSYFIEPNPADGLEKAPPLCLAWFAV